MKYEILEIVEPVQLHKKEAEGYNVRTVKRSVLQPIAIYGFNPFHDTMDQALVEIQDNRAILKDKILTIIPIIVVDVDGNVR